MFAPEILAPVTIDKLKQSRINKSCVEQAAFDRQSAITIINRRAAGIKIAQ